MSIRHSCQLCNARELNADFYEINQVGQRLQAINLCNYLQSRINVANEMRLSNLRS